MPPINKQLDEILTLFKGLQGEVKVLKEEGKSRSEKSEKMISDLMEKREKAIQDDLISRFRKGEHLTPPGDENAEPHKVLISKSADPKVQEFQSFNDDLLILSKIMRVHPSQTRLWKKNQAQVSELRKAISAGTSGSGSEWVPTDFSADLIDKFRLELKLGAFFRHINMPTNPYKLPGLTGDTTAYKISESTSDSASKITASTPTSAAVTLTAVKLAARTLWSEESAEDLIVPVLPLVKDNLARIMAESVEDALINGDSDGDHFDIDITDPTDHRKSWNGLRARSRQSSDEVSLSTFNAANLRSMRRKMGKYGVNPGRLGWLTGPVGMNHFLGLDELITLDKYGPAATILTGEVGRFDGSPVIISEKVREDLNSVGVHDVTNTGFTHVTVFNRDAFIMGDRRKMTMKSVEDIETDQMIMVVTMRGDFQDLYTADADKIAISGIGLAV